MKKNNTLISVSSLFITLSLFSIPPHYLEFQKTKDSQGALSYTFLKTLANFFSPDYFIESGTFLGETSKTAAAVFAQVHTIELGNDLYQNACNKFRTTKNITVHHGDSGIILGNILPHLKGSKLLWLDGHYSEGITACGTYNTPIMQELGQIKAHDRNAIILIDDINLFYPKPGPREKSLEGYPTLSELYRTLKDINPLYECLIIGDILLAFPSNKNITVSPLLRALTTSYFFQDSDTTILELLEAEKIIGKSEKHHADIIALSQKFNAPHYHLWHALILLHNKEFEQALIFFDKAEQSGLNSYRIAWYKTYVLSLVKEQQEQLLAGEQ